MNKSQIAIQIFRLVSFVTGKKIAKRLLFIFFYKKSLIRHRLLFVHIPKAAGTSIATALYGKRVGHFTARELREFLGNLLFAGKKKFTVVRNPYDRLLSAYTYAVQGGSAEGAVSNSSMYRQHEFRTFDSFVAEWLVYQRMEDIELIFKPQYLFVYEGEKLLVDFVGKVEEMTLLQTWLCDEMRSSVLLPHVNRSMRDGEKRMKDSTADLVYRLYQEDFNKFNYSKKWQ